MAYQVLTGIWKSRYKYHRSSRKGEFESEHIVRAYQNGRRLVLETIPMVNKSYLLIQFSVDENVATGSWQEETDPEGYYKGAMYYGAIQVVIDNDKKHMKGKWAGFGRDLEVVNTGQWEFTYLGPKYAAVSK
jgi:hypothetical protein